MRVKGYLIFSLGALLFASAACSFNVSTANLSSLKLGKDKAATQETSSFAAADTIYGVATVSNNPGKVKVKGRLLVEDVQGEKPGPIPGFETTVELPGSGTATFTFTPPTNGWPVGKYKLEVVMINEDGVEKDQKTAPFSIS